MDFSKLKQRLTETFERIQQRTQHGELPAVADAEQFARHTRLLLSAADDDWAGEAEDFDQLAQQLVQVVKKGLLEDSIMLVESLDDAQNYCHRTFRDV